MNYPNISKAMFVLCNLLRIEVNPGKFGSCLTVSPHVSIEQQNLCLRSTKCRHCF
jgi:hypothetical protein